MTQTPEELTNDWQDGKLERGWYYVKSGDEVYPDYFNGYFIQTGDKYGTEVLAPVPSYDHFIELTEKIKTLSSENERLLNLQAVKNKEIEELESDSLAKKEGEEIVAELTNENNNLRSLLKECDGCVRCLRAFGVSDCNGNNLNDLITKIEEVLK